MKKSSIIFKVICLAICFALALSVLPAVADEVMESEEAVAEDTVEIVTEAEEAVEDETVVEEPQEEETTVEDEPVVEEPEESETVVPEEEVIDLFTATMRDNGVYVTPGEDNIAVFNYDGVRYKVEKGTGNSIKLDGFESNPTIETEPDAEATYRLQANGQVTTDAAHSGYFGLSVETGDVVYRTDVASNQIYVFSAWMKIPAGGAISENDRAFKVIGTSGTEYIVGYNELGRDVDITGSWQQVLFTFRAPEEGVFEIDFAYRGSQNMALDDIELYEASVFENPLDIVSIVATDANGNEYINVEGRTTNKFDAFTTSGKLTHTTVLYNNDEDDVHFAAVMALYKNDILVESEWIQDYALVLDETEVTFEIEIPEDEDLSQYKYMVYFISDTSLTKYYGYLPDKTNPCVVKGSN